jgi:putative hydrolase of the HAD superfamily
MFETSSALCRIAGTYTAKRSAVPLSLATVRKAALFDAGDTLVHWSVHIRDRFCWVCEQAGVEVPADPAARLAASRATARFFYAQVHRPDSWTTPWWIEQIEAGLAELGLPRELAAQVAAHRQSLPNSWSLDPEAIPVLTELRRRGYRIGLVSNWDGTLASVCSDLGLTSLVDYVGDSHVFGDRKPSAAFFHHVLNQLGVAPEAAFHVGDTYDDDIAGARAAGITPILLDPLECESRSCETRITSLAEVLTLLDRQA